MRGHVLGVDTRTGEGMITGEDGRRYSFRPPDWAHRGEPAVGLYVDFEATENRALSIFPVPNAATAPATIATGAHWPAPEQMRESGSDRNKLIAALLAFFLGPIGVHRFYLGRIGSGVTMLILSCTFIGLILTVPWALIDMIRYLVMSDREFAARYKRLED